MCFIGMRKTSGYMKCVCTELLRLCHPQLRSSSAHTVTVAGHPQLMLGDFRFSYPPFAHRTLLRIHKIETTLLTPHVDIALVQPEGHITRLVCLSIRNDILPRLV